MASSFLDLPSQQQREAIWNIHLQQFGIPTDQPRPVDTDWTGAEIKACCRLAALLDLSLQEAAKNVVPIAHTAEESVSRLRSWAQGRCLDAERGGIYRGSAAQEEARGGGDSARTRRRTEADHAWYGAALALLQHLHLSGSPTSPRPSPRSKPLGAGDRAPRAACW